LNGSTTTAEAAVPEATSRPLKIAIAAIGRYHVLDLARELAARGHEVRFYNAVPERRTRRFGLPPRCHVSILPWLLPFLALDRWIRTRSRGWIQRPMYLAANRAVMSLLEPCDVFIGMSGIYLEAAEFARRQFGARLVVERGSMHILSQREILSAIGAVPPTDYVVRRELKAYDIADMIAVPSLHVADSFRQHGVAVDKTFVNPYGVDMSMFKPLPREPREQKTLLFVGRWSLRKGADLVCQALDQLPGVQLLHAGAVEGGPFPSHPRMRSLGHVDQAQLVNVYNSADLLVLPSREEGLSLVLIQALACGLPLVCSERSGGRDLQAMIGHPESVIVIPLSAEALAEGIRRGLAIAEELGGHDLLGESARQALTWKAYARRYEDALQALVMTP
jgi:starch synthase